MTIETEVLRAGRRVELAEARLSIAGRTAVVARAWRSQVLPGSAPARPAAPARPPELPAGQPQRYFVGVEPSWGYGRAIEWRFVRGSYDQAGPVSVWARPRVPLVAGEPITALQRALIIADSANGLSAELDFADWLFVPPTLTVTVHREPLGEWILLTASSVIDPRGTGMAHATLSDTSGEFGVATQPLLVQRRSS